jgi:hypothetical protein
VLTGLTSSTGGMVAAATTSLPERSEAGRTYDYRYAWIRDQCYAGQAIAAHNARPELLDAAVNVGAERILADGDQVKPAYTVTGGPVPAQWRVPLRTGRRTRAARSWPRTPAAAPAILALAFAAGTRA